MGYSVFPAASANASNDFTVNVGSTGFTNVALTSTFPAGSYIATSSLNDTTLDIYLVASDGSSAGYANATTASTTVTATKAFNTVVVYGGANNDTLAFVFKNVFAPADVSLNTGAAPRAISASVSTLPNQNDTVVITGQNFASGITATFTGQDSVVRNAKAVSRSSSTSITVTRPDSMPPAQSSYTLTLANPGIADPTSTNSHKLINSFGSGVVPVWVTGSVLNTIVYGTAFSQQLSATDADGGSSVTYALVSGSFPTGISVSSSGLISGTSTSTTQGDYAVTISATDSGGNTVNKAFTMTYAAATGGTITSSGTTVFHTFNTTANFVNTRTLTLNYTITGGGGGGGGATSGYGGSWGGSGGGGGASIASGSTSRTAATYLVTCGAAGNAGSGFQAGGAGGTSSIANITNAAGANGGNTGPANGNNGGNGGTGGTTGGNAGSGNQNPGGNSGNAGANGGSTAAGAGGGGGGGGGFNNGGGGAGGTPFGGSGGFGGRAGNSGDSPAGPGSAANGAGGGGGGGGSGGYRNAGANGGAGGGGQVVISYS